MAWPILGVVLRAMAGGAARSGARRANRAAAQRNAHIARQVHGVGRDMIEIGRIAQRGPQVSIEVVDEDGLKQALHGLADRTQNMQSAFDEIGSALLTRTQERFEDEAGPDGSPWPEHSFVTLRRRGAGAPKRGIFTHRWPILPRNRARRSARTVAMRASTNPAGAPGAAAVPKSPRAPIWGSTTMTAGKWVAYCTTTSRAACGDDRDARRSGAAT